jgi:hypothetical protein
MTGRCVPSGTHIARYLTGFATEKTLGGRPRITARPFYNDKDDFRMKP